MGFGGLRENGRNIWASLIAAALGGGLTPFVTTNWMRFFHQDVPDWAKGVLPNALPALVLIPSFFVGTRRIFRTAAARGDKLCIYVARLGEDPASESARRSVIDAIQQEL